MIPGIASFKNLEILKKGTYKIQNELTVEKDDLYTGKT